VSRERKEDTFSDNTPKRLFFPIGIGMDKYFLLQLIDTFHDNSYLVANRKITMPALKYFHKTKMILAVFLLAIAVSACEKPPPEFQCNDSLGCVRVAPGAPLKIGILQALTGEVASIGKDQIRGIELALEDRQGKVAGHDVAFQIEDTGCSEEGGANAVLKILADPEYIAILGTTCSGAATSVSKAMSAAGLTMISGNNSAPFLTAIADKRAPHWQPGYFRTAPNEENAGKAAAMYAVKILGIGKAAVINDGDIYTRGLTDNFVKMFQNLGGEVVLNTSINKGDQQMKPVLTATLDAGAQFLFYPLFQPEGNYILLQAREMRGFEQLTKSAQALRKGHLGVVATQQRDDEIGELCRTFNFMAVRIRDLVENLEKTVA